MRKVKGLKAKLKRMGSPWERKYKREKEENNLYKIKKKITREEFKKLFDEKTENALKKKEHQLNNQKIFEKYKNSKQYQSSLRSREKNMLKNYIITDAKYS